MVVAMTIAASALSEFRAIGGALCLDFANTVDWHDSATPVELLDGSASLSAWARLVDAGAVEADEAGLRRAIELREAVRASVRAVIDGAPVPAPAVAVLNRNLGLGPERRRLVVHGHGVTWTGGPVSGVDALLARIARSAADLLTDPDRLGRVRVCAADGCGWLFVDDSRGARRRWCSMQSCGNRAKARAHYRRKRA